MDSTSQSNSGGRTRSWAVRGRSSTPITNRSPGPAIQLDAAGSLPAHSAFPKGRYDGCPDPRIGRRSLSVQLNGGTADVVRWANSTSGIFVNDDWRVRSNLTLSYGLRYEAQTNIGDHGDFAPRLGLAWGIGGKNGRTAKTILRAGSGTFFDRVASSLVLQALGTTARHSNRTFSSIPPSSRACRPCPRWRVLGSRKSVPDL